MKKFKLLIVAILFASIILLSKVCDAYGFGFKKNYNNTKPDIGIYQNILDENNGRYVGDESSKKVYLTFDCGYENGNTLQILDTLENYNVKATFFLTGHYIESASDLVLRMVNDGHVLGNHSYKHKNITKISDDEITKEIRLLEEAYKRLTGKTIDPFYRPPEGEFDRDSLSHISSLGYMSVFWSIAYKDWNKENSVEYIIDEISKNAHNGAIILMHTVSKNNSIALAGVIEKLTKMGYTFSTPYDLINSE